jgi:hypothetical protein
MDLNDVQIVLIVVAIIACAVSAFAQIMMALGF